MRALKPQDFASPVDDLLLVHKADQSGRNHKDDAAQAPNTVEPQRNGDDKAKPRRCSLAKKKR
jgi:hypothetical protein